MPNALKLQQAALGKLAPQVVRPAYSRQAIKNGIVHIGVGGFHRAHQAVYMDDLLQRGVTDWGICGVGLLPSDFRMRDALVPQECLYTVVERGAGGDSARVIGSLTRYLLAPDDPEAVLEILAHSDTRIVSLTITEGGYNFNEATKEFDFAQPDIAHDLANPQTPKSVFGFLAEALDRRRKENKTPFTLLSCDNLPHNGDMARRTLMAFAACRDPTLAEWISENVTFPNSMVDRITPQTTDTDREMVQKSWGIADTWPVVCEPFRQWIIEDKFCAGRPPWEDVGVQFVADSFPYELMKLRLLNASHSAMGYLGYLAGYRFIPDVIADPLFHDYIKKIMDEEITPLLSRTLDIDLVEYKETLLTRFANPAIADQVSRICLDGSSKMPKFILPSVLDAAQRGRSVNGLCLAVAGWFRYLTGIDEEGKPIAIDDPLAADLQSRALRGGFDPRPLLELEIVFGGLSSVKEFMGPLTHALRELYDNGARAAVENYVRGAFAGNT